MDRAHELVLSAGAKNRGKLYIRFFRGGDVVKSTRSKIVKKNSEEEDS